MRIWTFVMLSSLATACGASPAPAPAPALALASDPPLAAPRPRRARAVHGVTTVTLVDTPGPLVDGNAPPPLPGRAPVVHPALNGSCVGDALDCSAAGSVVRGARTFDAAIAGLEALGYEVTFDSPTDRAPTDSDRAPADIAPADIAPADIAPDDIAPAEIDPAPIDVAPADTPRSSRRLAGHDEVCASGEHGSGAQPRPCAPGLQCCYPCGIQGCDSVCHTPAECRADRMRP